MNCQSLIALHEFTAENGATAVVPGSQSRGVYPGADDFAREHIQLSCPAGSLLLFVGMIWHCSMPNNSSGERTSVLGQYLPKFVKPMEALDQSVARMYWRRQRLNCGSCSVLICAIQNCWKMLMQAMPKAGQHNPMLLYLLS